MEPNQTMYFVTAQMHPYSNWLLNYCCSCCMDMLGIYKESFWLLLNPFPLRNDNLPFFSLQYSFLSVQTCLILQKYLIICVTVAQFIPQDNTVTVTPRKKQDVTEDTTFWIGYLLLFQWKTLSHSFILPARCKFCFFNILFIFCSYRVQYTTISVPYVVPVLYMHFSLQAQSHIVCHQFSTVVLLNCHYSSNMRVSHLPSLVDMQYYMAAFPGFGLPLTAASMSF